MQNQHFFTYPLNVRFSLKADLTLPAPCQQQTLQTEERSALFRLPLFLKSDGRFSRCPPEQQRSLYPCI